MKQFLLDTCSFLWSAKAPQQLSKTALQIIENPDNVLFLSSVSAYEIAFKHKLGKLGVYGSVAESYGEVARKLSLIDLPVSRMHALKAGQLPWRHRDPFDRIIAAQASSEKLILITIDTAFEQLDWLETVW